MFVLACPHAGIVPLFVSRAAEDPLSTSGHDWVGKPINTAVAWVMRLYAVMLYIIIKDRSVYQPTNTANRT